MAREDFEVLRKRIDELETENLALRERIDMLARNAGQLVPDGTPLALGNVSLGVAEGDAVAQVPYRKGEVIRDEHLAMLVEGQHYRRFRADQLSF